MRAVRVILRDSIKQLDRPYSYIIPDGFGEVVPGSYLKVPFGNSKRSKDALVIEVYDECDEKVISKLKTPDCMISDLPVMKPDQMEIFGKVASRFNCTMGQSVALFVPSFVSQIKGPVVTMVTLADKAAALEMVREGKFRSYAHIRIIEYLAQYGSAERKVLMNSTKASAAQMKSLSDKGIIVQTKAKADFEPEEETEVHERFTRTFDLNNAQKAAVRAVTEEADPDKKEVFLLHGITGSGKTEVYLNCAEKIVAQGGGVIYMVPEISLTPQTIGWIKGRLGTSVAVLHSRLTDRERFRQWDLIRRGVAKIVVGPRSGIFAPVDNLKLIIIDEEHDGSYKSESHPRYNTRDIAVMRAQVTGAKIILGSATPSVESYYAAQKGYYHYLSLPSRARADSVLPTVHPVDMKEQIKLGAGQILSLPLRNAMARAFASGNQAMLFLNRRGYSRSLVCSECGEPACCVNCSVAMTLHSQRNGEPLLICHYCGYTIPAKEAVCQSCRGNKFIKAGFGTQQLEEALGTLFPGQKVLRMDQDSTISAESYKEIIDSFAAGDASILIGTQMIAKGHDFPKVTVVGILGADLMLASSNCKASERAFQLITQAAGRAGRSSARGEVYIQSLRPDMPLFGYAAAGDYEAFYKTEIEYRERMHLPPFKACGELTVQSEDETKLRIQAADIATYVKTFTSYQDARYGFEVFGPIPDVIYELRGRYRMNIIIKAANKSAINAVFEQVAKDFDAKIYQISYDNDAVN